MPLEDQNISTIQCTDYESSDFRPIKLLGFGDMGTVFLAVLRKTGQPFAMKIMDKEVVETRESLQRVQREAEVLSTLDHPFLPKLFANFESKRHIYFVMDYCPGGDMNILRRAQPERKFSENAARFYAAEVVLAIDYLHKNGIIYRDLKPENVLIQENGHIMLTDFDLSIKLEKTAAAVSPKEDPKLQNKKPAKASRKKQQQQHRRGPFMCGGPMSVNVVCASHKAVDVKQCQEQQQQYSRSKTKRIFPSEMKGKRSPRQNQQRQEATAGGFGGCLRSDSIVGTEEYVAPEMVLGSGHGMALDWWTLGILLYELLYGTTPFKGKSRRDTFINIIKNPPAFPGSLNSATDLISQLLVKDPSKRLGFMSGAEEIKSHHFFEGVDWEVIELVSRPPYVPPPLVVVEPEREIVVDQLMKAVRSPGSMNKKQEEGRQQKQQQNREQQEQNREQQQHRYQDDQQQLGYEDCDRGDAGDDDDDDREDRKRYSSNSSSCEEEPSVWRFTGF